MRTYGKVKRSDAVAWGQYITGVGEKPQDETLQGLVKKPRTAQAAGIPRGAEDSRAVLSIAFESHRTSVHQSLDVACNASWSATPMYFLRLLDAWQTAMTQYHAAEHMERFAKNAQLTGAVASMQVAMGIARKECYHRHHK